MALESEVSAKVDNLATGLSNQIADIQESCISAVGDSWLFLEQGQNMATEALPSKDLVSGTVYLLSCELQTFYRLYSETNSKLICLTSRN